MEFTEMDEVRVRTYGGAIGTNIWFDYYWRIHISKIKGN